ncbi:MAG: TraB/GumN family protein [Candidatus Methylumidiphilus sp.]
MLNHKIDLAGFISMALLGLALCTAAEAGLYKCTDRNNKIYYQDKPCQDLIAARLPSNLTRLAGKEEERAFFWKASGEKGTVFLLGAPHFGDKSFYPLPQMVIDSVSNADAVVVESDIWNYDDKARAGALKGRGRYEDKKDNLENHVLSVTWNKAVDMGNKLGINEEMLRQYKPWLASLLLASESLKQSGFYNPDMDLDKTFLKNTQGKKPIMELESVEEQVSLFDGLSGREQEQMLLQTLNALGRGPDRYKTIAEAWKKGDLEYMDQIVKQPFDNGDVSMKLLKLFFEDRSERIANRLKELAEDGRTYFAVVGAGYLGGDKGVLKLLEAKGFKVVQP